MNCVENQKYDRVVFRAKISKVIETSPVQCDFASSKQCQILFINYRQAERYVIYYLKCKNNNTNNNKAKQIHII